jgi:hypothetical protein
LSPSCRFISSWASGALAAAHVVWAVSRREPSRATTTRKSCSLAIPSAMCGINPCTPPRRVATCSLALSSSQPRHPQRPPRPPPPRMGLPLSPAHHRWHPLRRLRRSQHASLRCGFAAGTGRALPTPGVLAANSAVAVCSQGMSRAGCGIAVLARPSSLLLPPSQDYSHTLPSAATTATTATPLAFRADACGELAMWILVVLFLRSTRTTPSAVAPSQSLQAPSTATTKLA